MTGGNHADCSDAIRQYAGEHERHAGAVGKPICIYPRLVDVVLGRQSLDQIRQSGPWVVLLMLKADSTPDVYELSGEVARGVWSRAAISVAAPARSLARPSVASSTTTG